MSKNPFEPILVVDDDQRLLDGLVRAHRKRYDLHVACGPETGLAALENEGPFAVVVSDYQMPGMNGITFLSKVKQISPDSVRIMLTGNADSQTAIEAVNRGQIFRFLTKPCPDEVFAAGLNLALEQYRLVTAERVLLEDTLQGCVQVLADVLSLVNPLAFGRAVRLRSYVGQIARRLGVEQVWQYETAALLSQTGCVGIPENILARAATGQQLDEAQQQMLDRHPETARELLQSIPRLEAVAEMIAFQNCRTGLRGSTELPLGSRILKIALDFDDLIASGTSRSEAVAALRKREGWYDAQALRAVEHLELPGQDAVVRTVQVAMLRQGMILDEDVNSAQGSLLVSRGQEVTVGMLERLRNHARLGVISDSLRVKIPTPSMAAAGVTAS